MTTQKEEAAKALTELFLLLAPAMVTEEQQALITDKVYDLVNDLLDAVREQYHVVTK